MQKPALELTPLFDHVGLQLVVLHPERFRGLEVLSHRVKLLAGDHRSGDDFPDNYLDSHRYDTAVDVSDAEFAVMRLKPSRFHGDWNHAIG